MVQIDFCAARKKKRKEKTRLLSLPLSLGEAVAQGLTKQKTPLSGNIVVNNQL